MLVLCLSFFLILVCFLAQNRKKKSSGSRGHRDIHVVCVVMCCELHVPSCERALAEEQASSSDTVEPSQLFKGFAKPLRNTGLFLWNDSFKKTFCLFELFPASVILSFSVQMPPLLVNICVVMRGENLEPLVYFRIKKTSSVPAVLPTHVHSLSTQAHTHRHTTLSVLGKVLQGKSLP